MRSDFQVSPSWSMGAEFSSPTLSGPCTNRETSSLLLTAPPSSVQSETDSRTLISQSTFLLEKPR